MVKHCLSLFILAVFGACQTTDIQSDYDPSTDFSGYKTFSVCLDDFQITSRKHPEYNSQPMKELFKEAIDSEMKQYYAINDSAPELRSGVKINITDKKFTYRSCDRSDDYHGWENCRINTYEYTEGTVLIYVADVVKNQVIWQASVSGMTQVDLIENKKVIRRTVQDLFQTYPLKAGAKTPLNN